MTKDATTVTVALAATTVRHLSIIARHTVSCTSGIRKLTFVVDGFEFFQSVKAATCLNSHSRELLFVQQNLGWQTAAKDSQRKISIEQESAGRCQGKREGIVNG